MSDETLVWQVDPLWLRSILDNLFQNVIRHARSGSYIGVETVSRDRNTFLAIKDKEQGMDYKSEAKGAGIGPSILSLMTKEMDIDWEISSSSNGTCHFLGSEIKLNKLEVIFMIVKGMKGAGLSSLIKERWRVHRKLKK